VDAYLVAIGGIEPPTSGLWILRSLQRTLGNSTKLLVYQQYTPNRTWVQWC